MHIDDEARLAGLLAAYLAADYQWEHEGAWQTLLIGRPASALESLFPEALQFGMLSAWNPGSVKLPDAVNRLADQQLHTQLEASGLSFRPGFAAAPNRSWREPTWIVVGMARPALDVLARDFGQLSTLHWQRTQPVGLRMHAARPPAMADQAFVDWVP